VRVFVSIDLEGCTGVRDLTQTRPDGAGYPAALGLARGDLEAVLAGCRQAGATSIVVRDAHASGANLALEAPWSVCGRDHHGDDIAPGGSSAATAGGDLGADVRLISGAGGELGMMEGIDESCDTALLVGYHAMAGTRAAVLDHTFTHSVFRVRVDDAVEAGELALNAAVAGAFAVPVVFASGDDKLALEAQEILPGVHTTVVKEGIARQGARLAPPSVTGARLRAAVTEALAAGERPRPLAWDERPLRVVFTRSDFADAAAACLGVERVDARGVRIDAPRYLDAYRTLLACLRLVSTVSP
jgi:D-amino peptidase